MCKFCALMKQVKDTHDYYKKPNYTFEINVALVSNNYYKNDYTGSCTHHNQELNFCPECGKKINENEKK